MPCDEVATNRLECEKYADGIADEADESNAHKQPEEYAYREEKLDEYGIKDIALFVRCRGMFCLEPYALYGV